MTQLDVPTISFARYVDLLKRRKWQVIPISLLGMLVGTVVALMVPRFYVASAEVRYSAEQFAEKGRDLEEQLLERLDSARTLIPALVGEVLQKLGWPEALSDDFDARVAFEADVKRRINIIDKGPNRKNRTFSTLQLEYRDTDGPRAASFTNELCRAWVDGEIGALQRLNEQRVSLVQERRRQALEDVAAISEEIAVFERQNGFDPAQRADLNLPSQTRQMEKLELERQIQQGQVRIARLEAEIDSAEHLRLEGGIPEWIEVPPPPPSVTDEQTILELTARALALRKNLRSYRDNTPQKTILKKELEEVQAELDKLTPKLLPQRRRNPAFLEQARLVEQKRSDLRIEKDALKATQARLGEVVARLALLPELNFKYREKLDREAAARKRLADANAELDAAEVKGRELRSAAPFQIMRDARMSPRPTEPSVVLLALIGSMLGLGAAIALVFALDAVRFTFKTIDDLERSLGVPVLGSMSHVETHLERATVRRGRITVTLLAVGLLTLIVAIVVIYYQAPARLPAFARELLDMLLGEGD